MEIKQMRGALAVAAPERDEMIFKFQPMEDGQDIILAIPSGSVGHLMTQMVAQHQKLALKATDNQAAVMPIELTGARAFWGAKGETVLMLQFAGAFELAVALPKNRAHLLGNAVQELAEGQPPPAPKAN